jgi:hypothetical protein
MRTALALASIALLSTSSVALAEGAATPTDQGADIEVHQSHNEASVDISASVGSSGRSGAGAVSSGRADQGSIGPRSK